MVSVCCCITTNVISVSKNTVGLHWYQHLNAELLHSLCHRFHIAHKPLETTHLSFENTLIYMYNNWLLCWNMNIE